MKRAVWFSPIAPTGEQIQSAGRLGYLLLPVPEITSLATEDMDGGTIEELKTQAGLNGAHAVFGVTPALLLADCFVTAQNGWGRNCIPFFAPWKNYFLEVGKIEI